MYRVSSRGSANSTDARYRRGGFGRVNPEFVRSGTNSEDRTIQDDAPIETASRHQIVRAFAWLALAYAAALAVAIGVGYGLRAYHPLIIVGAADAAATLIVFAFSRAFNNSSFYDPYWSLAPIVIVCYLPLAEGAEYAVLVRQLVVMSLVTFWGLRLTYNFLSGWKGLRHEDWRYINIRASSGRAYWLVSFSGIHFVPTLLVFLGCLSLYPAVSVGENGLGWLDVAAGVVTLGAVTIEAVADRQLRRFVRNDHAPGAILSSGLWKYTRHPNYFGEVSFWWGLYLFGLAADPSYWWTIIGPLAMTLLFVFISIPMLDKRSLARREGYAEHMRTTSALVPWFRG